MSDLCLVLQTDPPLAFYRVARPAGVDLCYPRLIGASRIRTGMRISGGEVGNCSVALDNGDGSLTGILSDYALLAPAVLSVDGTEIFSGVVQSVAIGSSAQLDLEAKGFTDPLPMRTAAALGEFQQASVLPIVYGIATVAPVQISSDGRQWLLADHAIAGVDGVWAGATKLGAWSWRNTLDDSGHTIAMLETQSAFQQGALSVTMRGAMHPATGALLDTPDAILWHLLTTLGGLTLDAGALDDLRAWCADTGVKVGGVLSGSSLTLQSAADLICEGCGLAWSPLSRGLAQPWPPIEADAITTVTRVRSPVLRATADGRNRVTHLDVSYDWDDAAGEYRGTMTLAALDVVEDLGREVRQSLSLPWLRSARDVLEHASRRLAWLARITWEITAAQPRGIALEGDWAQIDHPYSPLSSGIIRDREISLTGELWTLTGAQGNAPTVTMTASALKDPIVSAVED